MATDGSDDGSDGYRRAPEFVAGGDIWSWRPEKALMVEKPRKLAGRVAMRKSSPERDVLMVRGGPGSCLGRLFSRVDLALIRTGSDSGPSQ